MSEPNSDSKSSGERGAEMDPTSDQNEKGASPDVSSGLPLEWTKLGGENLNQVKGRDIRYPSDCLDYSNDPEETYLEIIGTAGLKITNMGKDLSKTCSPNLTHLILRSHLISKMEGIKGFQKLELLELYDNQIEYLEELGDDESEERNMGESLKTLDMSYNVIRSMEPVKFCTNLTELYLANNKLKSLQGLQNLTSLRKIDLGANRIRVMDANELSGLINLEELWLGKNKIEKIQGLEKLKKLRRLDIQSNRLTSIENLTSPVDSLEELYLAHNGIDDAGAMQATGLGLQFTELTTLDLSKNRITTCKPFVHLNTINELWLSSNNIASFQDIEPISVLGTRDGACLTEVYMEYNPIYEDFEYRKKLKELIPSLIQIDANVIGATGHGSAIARTMTPEAKLQQMKLLQEKALERAKKEKEQKETSTTEEKES
jgi:protein phosphatase 1 regulatory subunit 7